MDAFGVVESEILRRIPVSPLLIEEWTWDAPQDDILGGLVGVNASLDPPLPWSWMG